MRTKSKRFGQRSSKPNTKLSSAPGEDNGRSVIFGILPVLESLRARGRKINKILISSRRSGQRLSEIVELAKQRKIPVERVSVEELSNRVKHSGNHQGVLAIAAPPSYYNSDRLIEVVAQKERSLSLILDGIEDPGNLGAMLRTAECAGVDGVFIPDRRAVGLNDTVAKSSSGASEYVKIAKVTNINRLIDDLQKRNVWIVGTSGDADMEYTQWDWSQSTAVVLGAEGKGLHRLTAEKCDVLVKIPMYGRIESLNVSVATGVILFESIRQRKKDQLCIAQNVE